jgi:uncharacterized SAM-dependent methyltransferase
LWFLAFKSFGLFYFYYPRAVFINHTRVRKIKEKTYKTPFGVISMAKSPKSKPSAKNSQINDLIFKELLKRGYSLEGNTCVFNIADSKLWYLTSDQAQAYLDVEKSPDYKKEMIDKEIELLRTTMPEISKSVIKKPETVIIDIGCGDGKKAVVPINYLKDKTKIVYCPIDISSYMVEKAIENIGQLNVGEIVKFRWNISDFENLENVNSLLRVGGKELFMLFLGSTLGNFEMHEVLYQITSAMEPGDSLLIGVALNNLSPEQLEKSYKSSYSDYFLGKVLEQIGFTRDEIEFGVRFRHSRVESYYTIKCDKTISFQDKRINFRIGDQIVVAYSYKYSKKTFENAIKLYFKNYRFFLNKDKSWAEVFCKK